MNETRARGSSCGLGRSSRSASAWCVGDAGDDEHELLRVDRLGHVRLESFDERATPIFRARVGGEGDGGQRSSSFSAERAHPADEAEAVFLGESAVGQEDVGAVLLEQAHSLGGRVCGVDDGLTLAQ